MIRTTHLTPFLVLLIAQTALAAPASVTLHVPVGATLTINGHPTDQMTGTRYFVSPELPAGPKFRYIFVAAFTWNGEEVTRKKQLDVVAGGTYTVDMMTGEPVKQAVPVEEPVKPVVVPKVEAPKPTPPKVEQPKPKVEEPKPAPKVEQPKPEEPKPAPKPAPKPDKPKPKQPIAQPERQVAPKPREVKPKK